MKKTLSAIGAALLCTAGLAHAGDWDAPQEPFAVYGNTYYVGPNGVSSVLLTSPAGHILIDGGTPKSPKQIAAHIKQLGFKLEDIKLILMSHEHFDHVGGLAELQRLSGATVVASPVALAVLKAGKSGPSDPQFGHLEPFAAIGAGRTVADGETLSVGPLKVTAHYTPGHTPGGTSWTWQSSEGGKTMNMVYVDSLNAYGDKTFRYGGDARNPTARADLERSIETVAGFKCDILLSAHPEVSDLWTRKARQPALGHAAFIDTSACRTYAQKGRARLAEQLAEEAKRQP